MLVSMTKWVRATSACRRRAGHAVQAAEVSGNRHVATRSDRRCRPSAPRAAFSCGAKPLPLTRLPTAVSQVELQRCAGRKAFALQDRARADRALRRVERQRGAWRRAPPSSGSAVADRVRRRPRHRSPGVVRERELRPRQFSDRRLLVVQVALSLPAGVQLRQRDRPPGRSRGSAPRPNRGCLPRTRSRARWLSQLTTQVLSIVRQPSPVTLNSIGVPTGPDAGSVSKRLRDVDAVLRDRLAVDERDHFVHAAVVFGNGERASSRPRRIDDESSERRRRLRIFLAAEVIVVLDRPSRR